MTDLNRLTKAQLIEMIEEKEQEIREMSEDVEKYRRVKAYEDITDEIKDVYDKLMSKGFDKKDSIELVHSLIADHLIPAPKYMTRGNRSRIASF